MAQSSCQTLDVNGSMAIESTGNDVESAKQVAGRCSPVSSFLGIGIRKVSMFIWFFFLQILICE